MKLITRLLILTIITGGGIYFAQSQGYLQNIELGKNWEETKEQFEGSVKGITDDLGAQAEKLTNRGQTVGSHVNNVLGSYIQPVEKNQGNNSTQSNTSTENSSSTEQTLDKPIYEETLDYGRYLYCQQVIKDYENQHPDN